ncbi:SWI6 [[Candida] subhashii]|uniref:SWI6 n=1 Tax=[Candida] subhashii TaxID=561895 RepID=A0A8J5UP25_9ASCO|nr:SWI6 [[Candida] subhashii]KAG7663991.1 SWI6 [[Candida] subhashii]
MDSPINIGDITANSISHRLHDTHLNTRCISTVNSAIYSGQKFIQLSIKFDNSKPPSDNEIIILRKVQDSFINISQLLSILIHLKHLTTQQLETFLNNEILTNGEYNSSTAIPQVIDLRNKKDFNPQLRGIWISYDKAVNLALKFDIYEFTKKMFLIDVHDFDNLPKATKRLHEEGDDKEEEQDNRMSNTSITGSPAKRQKLNKDIKKEEPKQEEQQSSPKESLQHISIINKLIGKNENYPFTLPPIMANDDNAEIANQIRFKLGEIFKQDDEGSLTFQDIKSALEPILERYPLETICDVPLDQKKQTALHFASTLASLNLVSAFITLGLNSPIRGNINGESPLICTIQVTNSMEKGNFQDLLVNWLYLDIWLLDNKKWSILHHLASQSKLKFESSKFYMTKIIEYIIGNDRLLYDLRENLINYQDDEDGNTALHIAIESESKWFIKILIDLGADINLANKRDVKSIDFEIVKDLIGNETGEEFENEHIFELIKTGVEFLTKRLEINGTISEIEEPKPVEQVAVIQEDQQEETTGSSSTKIFQSIQQLLSNTNTEYENILNSKREQIKNLDKSLHDTTISTANNRFVAKKISEKLGQLDNLKLQIANITDKLAFAKQELKDVTETSNGGVLDELDENKEYDADEPFLIQPIYERLVKGESVDDLKNDQAILSQLQPKPILKARIDAYKQINESLEKELNTLLDYSELTSKFKKVVSICTGVDINEVDELLDGLLEAVEGQQ